MGTDMWGRRQVGVPITDPSRPWLGLRDDETPAEWGQRVSHSCYRCGQYDEDMIALDAHESAHEGQGTRNDRRE